MSFQSQPVIPAAKNIKDYERLLRSPFEYFILLGVHLSQLPSLMQLAKQSKKKVILHADMIRGLKNDESGAQFICQMLRPAGVISTHASVIVETKKNGMIAIQRVFLLDSHSLETSFRVLQTSKPDYIELLPGIIPALIKEVKEQSNIPVVVGGFIRTLDDIREALRAGATSVTTSHHELWVNDTALRT